MFRNIQILDGMDLNGEEASIDSEDDEDEDDLEEDEEIKDFMVEDNPDGHANVFLHEMGHMISISGLQKVESGFAQELSQAFSNAVNNGLWVNTYARTNKEEYFSFCGLRGRVQGVL